MAAESLLKGVEERVKRESAKLDAEYLAKEHTIEKPVEEEILKISESAKVQAVDLSQRERIRIEGAGKLQAKKLLFDATEKMLERNLSMVRQSFEEYARSKNYDTLLNQMVEYASRRLSGNIRVICRAEDGKKFEKTKSVKVISSALNSIGGFKAESEDGTIELDLTFEELLRNHQDEVRAFIQSAQETN